MNASGAVPGKAALELQKYGRASSLLHGKQSLSAKPSAKGRCAARAATTSTIPCGRAAAVSSQDCLTASQQSMSSAWVYLPPRTALHGISIAAPKTFGWSFGFYKGHLNIEYPKTWRSFLRFSLDPGDLSSPGAVADSAQAGCARGSNFLSWPGGTCTRNRLICASHRARRGVWW